jgi:glycerol-3-phosphate dehydrogenase (NAD(P)+)
VTKCAVVGAGAWGTALANVLAGNGHDTILWAREEDVVKSIRTNRENRRFLAGHVLNESLGATGDIAGAVAGAGVVTLAPPSHALRTVVRTLAPHLDASAVVCVASKGLEPDTLLVMTDVVQEELPDASVVAISGPSFASEVAAGDPTAVVAASASADAAARVQSVFSNDRFRVYTHHDVLGVELGGALKNVMAVAAGISDGLGLGYNSRAALITRGLAEMTRLGSALGAEASTFAGLAGLGDLVLTCTGPISRNHSVGELIGKGSSLEEALAGKDTVAEGVANTRNALALAKRAGVQMPIVEAVHRVLFENVPPRKAILELMTRELRRERDQ